MSRVLVVSASVLCVLAFPLLLLACGVEPRETPDVQSATDPTSDGMTASREEAVALPADSSPNTQHPRPPSPSPFLTVVIPPCVPYPGSTVDPCQRRSTWAQFNPFVHVSVEYPEIVRTLEEHILAMNDYPRYSAQFIVRAIPIPNTYRCAEAGFSYWNSQRDLYKEPTAFPGSNTCYVELAVNEYIFGVGPDRITMATGVILGRSADASAVAHWETELGNRIEGTEWIFFLTAPWNYGVTAWRMNWTLDVQMSESDRVVAVAGEKSYYEDNLPEHREINLSRLEMTLDKFRVQVRAAMKKYVALTGGRWGTGTNEFGGPFPMLASDASTETLITLMLEDRALQTLEVTPVGPPPVPGENDPNPDGLVINDIIATRVAGGVPVPGGLTDFDTPTPIVEDDLSPIAEATATVVPEAAPTPELDTTVTPEPAPTPEPEVAPTATPESDPVDTPTPEIDPTATPETEPTATPDPDAPVPPGDDDTDQGAPGETGNEGPGETGNGDGNGGQAGNGDTPGG